jgi:hemerythrin-like domain-containing protein
MNAVERLLEDHRALRRSVDALAEMLNGVANSDDRLDEPAIQRLSRLRGQLDAEIKAHEEREEKVLHELLGKTGADLVRSVKAEHASIQDVLRLLSSVMFFVAEGKAYAAKSVVSSLALSLKAHLDHEEAEVFPKLGSREAR